MRKRFQENGNEAKLKLVVTYKPCFQLTHYLQIALIELSYLTHENKHNNVEELTLARKT